MTRRQATVTFGKAFDDLDRIRGGKPAAIRLGKDEQTFMPLAPMKYWLHDGKDKWVATSLASVLDYLGYKEFGETLMNADEKKKRFREMAGPNSCLD